MHLVKGLIDSDIREAKKHLNISNGFSFDGHGSVVDDLDAVRDVIVHEKKPPLSYLILHSGSKLSSVERSEVLKWIEQEQPKSSGYD